MKPIHRIKQKRLIFPMVFLVSLLFLIINTTTFPSQVSALNNGLSPKPYMGWNTWYTKQIGWTYFSLDDLKQVADALVSRGFKDLGYNIVWIDSGWAACGPERNPDGTPNARFSLQEFTNYVHSKGLKAGIYTDTGVDGCSTCFGSAYHIQQDMNYFVAQGFDAVKVDRCGGDVQYATTELSYKAFRDAIANRMIYNICSWGTGNPTVWGPETGHSWRTDFDVDAGWAKAMRNFDSNMRHPEINGPNSFNDPDYLTIWDKTDTELRSQFTLWCLMASPLILGLDVVALPDATLDIYKNSELININQDPLCKQCTLVSRNGQSSYEWLELYFGGNTTFDKVILKESFNRITSFRLEKYNGSAWVEFATGTTIGASKTLTFAAQTAAQIRLVVLATVSDQGGDSPSIFEFEVYNGGSGNLALGATASSSSDWDAGYTASKANDGSMSTRWNSASHTSGAENLEVYKKDLTNTSQKAVALFNRTGAAANITVNWSDIGLSGSQPVRDLWAHANLGAFSNSYTANVPSHGVVAIMVGGTSGPTATPTPTPTSTGGVTPTPTSGTVNLALGKTASASSVWDSNYAAGKANDGDSTTTRWNADASDGVGAWLQIDFGGAVTFNQTILKQDYNRIDGYKIQYWNGSSWIDAYTGGNMGLSPKVDTFNSVTASKIRLYVTAVRDDFSYHCPSIWEFEVYNTGNNLALGKTATASSIWGAGYEAGKGNDGNLTTRWNAATGTGANEWLEINFGTNTTFNKTIISQAYNRITGYKIQYWNGSSWVDAYTGGVMGTNPKTDTFTAVTGSKVRLYVTSAQPDFSNTCPTIWEFEVYYQ